MAPGRRAARRAATVVAVALVFQLLLPLLSERAAAVVMGTVVAAIAGYACLGQLQQSRVSRGRARVGWTLALLVSALWSATNVGYALIPALNLPMTHPGPTDLLAMGSICLIPVVLVVLTPGDGGLRMRLRRLIDGATITAALVFLSWRFVVEPVLRMVPPAMRGMTVSAPAIEIVGCALALVAIARSRSSQGYALVLMDAALVVISITTLVDIYNVTFGLARYAHGVGAGYLCGTLLLAMSSRARLPSGPVDRGPGSEGPWGFLPYLPVGISFLTAAYVQLREGALDAVLFWVLLCTAVLVLARQFLNLRTNQELLRRVGEQRERLAHLAFHDPLTGLANRAMLSDKADSVLADAAPDSTTALLLLDLDGFKPVNDTYGHAAGDELLVVVADCLTRCVRPDDLVVRLGGDEFVVFMPRLVDSGEAIRIGERILRELDQPRIILGAEVPVRGSAGLAVTRGPGAAPDALLRDADVALYQAKAAGKNRLCLFPQSPTTAGDATADLPQRTT